MTDDERHALMARHLAEARARVAAEDAPIEACNCEQAQALQQQVRQCETTCTKLRAEIASLTRALDARNAGAATDAVEAPRLNHQPKE